MRKLFVLLFLCASTLIFGQASIQNMGSFYRLSVPTIPPNFSYPKPDSVSVRITVICPASQTYDVSWMHKNAHVDYKLKGIVYVAASAIWWRNGVKHSQTSLPTVCGFFMNQTNCFQKL